MGTTTTTQDAVGDIIETKPVNFDKNKIERLLTPHWEIRTSSPMYSATKVNERNYMSWQGKTVERKARKVYIYDISYSYASDQIELDILCSKALTLELYVQTLVIY